MFQYIGGFVFLIYKKIKLVKNDYIIYESTIKRQ